MQVANELKRQIEERDFLRKKEEYLKTKGYGFNTSYNPKES